MIEVREVARSLLLLLFLQLVPSSMRWEVTGNRSTYHDRMAESGECQ